MDPITGLATITQLIGLFVSERRGTCLFDVQDVVAGFLFSKKCLC